jgi:hypothetical protein
MSDGTSHGEGRHAPKFQYSGLVKGPFKKVRAARNPSAHRREVDKYDIALFEEEIKLMRDVTGIS